MFVKMTRPVSAEDEIRRRSIALSRADEGLRILTGTFMFTLQSEAPRDTGWMASSMATIEKTSRGYGVSPYTKIGAPSARSPRNTIRDFLEDYPQYRNRTRVKTKAGKPRKRLNRKRFPYAWYFLSNEAKRRLAALRRAGLYGMSGPSPRYWQAISEHRVPSASGGMRGDDFLEEAYAAAYTMSLVFAKNIFGTVVSVT
jgi:hypothetical protein